MEENNLRKIRLEKLEKLRSLGIDPYPASYDKTHTIAESLRNEGKTIKTAGRLFSLREHGNIAFADVKDETGKMQIFFQKKLLGDSFKLLKLLDVGDFIGVEGEVGRTVAGEISIIASSYTILNKSLLPFPNEWNGLKDTETRYRQRYLDLLLNPEARERFNIRTKLVSGTREYLDKLGFWEVETPTLQPLYGGANAKPFKTYLNALDQEMYLRIADELYLKRLIVGGYEKVYEICKDFRNEGIDQTHFPEFTMIEWYEAYADYNTMMDRAEGLLKHLAKKIHGNTVLKVVDKDIDIGNQWPRIEMSQIVKDRLGIDIEKETEKSLATYIKKYFPETEIIGTETKGQLFFAIFDHAIPKTLIEPTWIIDYPQEISPLSKPHRNKTGWVERFEGYIGGKEIFDGWSELNDPQIQRQRLLSDSSATRLDKEEAQHVDEDFLTAMEHGMPPFGGIGVGIDRLAMLLSNTWLIKEVILFPSLRPSQAVAKEINKLQGLEKQTQFNKPSTSKAINTDVFFINKKVSEKFPSISIGVAVIKGVTIQKKNDKLEKNKKDFLANLQNLTTEQINEFPEIKSYRKLYKEIGVDWHSRRPSPEALLRRVAAKKGLYTVNTCVDAYNLMVMKNRISAGAFDLDKLSLPTSLQFTQDTDEILLLGENEPIKYKNDEIAYFDQQGGFNIDFNYRDAQRTAVTLDTKNLYINIDGVYDISPQQVEHVLREVCDAIMKYCGGTLEVLGVVTANNTIHNAVVTLSKNNGTTMSREEAYELLSKHMQNKNLIKHSLSAEATMRALAKHFGENEDIWGITGLLHDVDYELAQKENQLDKHGILLFERDPNIIPEPMAHAIKAHNYTKTGVDPENNLDWSITCCDQLTGLIVAAALIHPDKKLAPLTVDFIMKRMGKKDFAKGADRETIKLCEEKLGIPLPEFIDITLKAMQGIHEELGL